MYWILPVSYTHLDVYKRQDQYGKDTDGALMNGEGPEVLYAFSAMRENLLEWFPFVAEKKLLQVGGGYGALTGLYARKVREVGVLDPVDESREVVRRRHAGLNNLRLENGSLPGWETAERFDYVVFVGSLTDRWREEMEAAKGLLAPGGVIIAAFDNRLGMRYWNGASRPGGCLLYTSIPPRGCGWRTGRSSGSSPGTIPRTTRSRRAW